MAGGIDSSESISGLLKRLQIRALSSVPRGKRLEEIFAVVLFGSNPLTAIPVLFSLLLFILCGRQSLPVSAGRKGGRRQIRRQQENVAFFPFIVFVTFTCFAVHVLYCIL